MASRRLAIAILEYWFSGYSRLILLCPGFWFVAPPVAATSLYSAG